MTENTFQNRIKQYIELRKQHKEAQDASRLIKDSLDVLAEDIRLEMAANDCKSMGYSDYTVSRVVKPKATIISPEAVVMALKNLGLDNEYVSEVPNEIFKASMLKQIEKGTMELAGVEVTETEYISVRNKKTEATNDEV